MSGARGATLFGGFRRADTVVRLLVLTQLAFNVGFFMVLPYLAVHLSGDLGQGAAVVGAVLGLRTLSQQGLFFVGGALADRLGTRPVVLLGCACRVVGFVTLGMAQSLVVVAVGAALTGFAGALFSPAVEAALARATAGPDGAAAAHVGRIDAFALFTAFGQLGTFVGPLVGAALLLVDFAAACYVAAALFVVIGCAHLRWLPRDAAREGAPASDGAPVWRAVVRDRRFLLFALVLSVQLVAYNQLYLLLPSAVAAAWGSQAPLGVLFAAASLLVVLAQLPIASRVAERSTGRAIAGGLVVMAVGFGIGGGVVAAEVRGPAALLLLGAFVAVFTCGQMVVGPVSRALIAEFADRHALGTYYGVFASVGGIMVLPAAIVTGILMDLDPGGERGAILAWVAMVVVLLAAAAVSPRIVSGGHGMLGGKVINGR